MKRGKESLWDRAYLRFVCARDDLEFLGLVDEPVIITELKGG